MQRDWVPIAAVVTAAALGVVGSLAANTIDVTADWWKPVLWSTVGVLVATAIALEVLRQRGEATAPMRGERPARRRIRRVWPLSVLGLAVLVVVVVAVWPSRDKPAGASPADVPAGPVRRDAVEPLDKFTADGSVNALEFTPDGTRLLALALTRVEIWDMASRTWVSSFETGQNTGFDLEISPDGRTAAIPGRDAPAGVLGLFDATSGAPLGDIVTTDEGFTLAVGFAPAGDLFATGDSTGAVQVWETGDRSRSGPPIDFGADPWEVRFSPDGRHLAVAGGGDTGKLTVVDVATRQPLGGIEAVFPSRVTALAFTPDGTQVVLGCLDGSVLVWNIPEWTETASLAAGNSIPVAAAEISPDARTVATDLSTGVQLWDVDAVSALGAPLVGHPTKVQALAFSPDGRVLASADQEGEIRLWRLAPLDS